MNVSSDGKEHSHSAFQLLLSHLFRGYETVLLGIPPEPASNNYRSLSAREPSSSKPRPPELQWGDTSRRYENRRRLESFTNFTRSKDASTD